MDSVIHAAGVCFGVGKLLQDDRSGVLRLDESLLGLVEGFDFVSEVLEIPEVGRLGFGICLEVEYLFNQSAEVMQGAYRRKRQIVRIAIQATNGTENESVFDDIEGDVAFVESGGQQAVLPIGTSGGCRSLAVCSQDLSDIVGFADWDVLHHVCGCRTASALRIAQRGSLDMHGVAVMAEPAQECLDHVAIAEEVGPFVVT